MNNQQKGFAPIIVVGFITILAIALTATAFYYKNQKEERDVLGNTSISRIVNFEQCAAAGYPVMESYPRRCSANGQTFTEVTSANVNIRVNNEANVNTNTNSNTNSTSNRNANINSNTNSATSEVSDNTYTIDTLRVGDVVVGMTVQKINRPLVNIEVKDNYSVQFTGQATVTGTYEYHAPNSGIINDTVCLTLDASSRNKLPTSKESTTTTWFCFTNDLAKQQFGPAGSRGTATVVIDNYYDITLGGEVWDKATLVRVLDKD